MLKHTAPWAPTHAERDCGKSCSALAQCADRAARCGQAVLPSLLEVPAGCASAKQHNRPPTCGGRVTPLGKRPVAPEHRSHCAPSASDEPGALLARTLRPRAAKAERLGNVGTAQPGSAPPAVALTPNSGVQSTRAVTPPARWRGPGADLTLRLTWFLPLPSDSPISNLNSHFDFNPKI